MGALPSAGASAGADSGDAIRERERLAGQIAQQLGQQGFYLTYLDPHCGQSLIDLRWAAQLAGRTVGSATTTYASGVGRTRPGKITVVVAPTVTSAFASERQSGISDLLEVLGLAHRQPA
jgi:hypothetical protein